MPEMLRQPYFDRSNLFLLIQEASTRLNFPLPPNYAAFACAISKQIMKYPVSYSCCGTIVDMDSAVWWRDSSYFQKLSMKIATQDELQFSHELKDHPDQKEYNTVSEYCPFCGDKTPQLMPQDQLRGEIRIFASGLENNPAIRLDKTLSSSIRLFLKEDPYSFFPIISAWQGTFLKKINSTQPVKQPAELPDFTSVLLDINEYYLLLFCGGEFQWGWLDYLIFPLLLTKYVKRLLHDHDSGLSPPLDLLFVIFDFLFHCIKFILYVPIALCVLLISLVIALPYKKVAKEANVDFTLPSPDSNLLSDIWEVNNPQFFYALDFSETFLLKDTQC